MKIIVLCDDQGDIQSVAIPNPELADRINVQTDPDGFAYELEVDRSVIDTEALLGVTSDEARKEVHEKLRKMIRSEHK